MGLASGLLRKIMNLQDYITEAISSRKHTYLLEPGELEEGDKVRVKSKDEILSMCHRDEDMDILKYHFDTPDRKGTYIIVNDLMLDMCDKKYKVDKIFEDGILVVLTPDRNLWMWHPNLLEKI